MIPLSYPFFILSRTLRIVRGLAIVALAGCPHPGSSQEIGASVSPTGVLIKDGKPYRAVGGSDPFDPAYWINSGDPSYQQTFASMQASGLTFARLTTLGFYNTWPSVSLYFTDKPLYFQKLDEVINTAAQHGVSVALGGFWTIESFCDTFVEPVTAAAAPGSRTYTAMRQFVTDLATHYKDNPAVLGFDCIGELNLKTDQPNAGIPVTARWSSAAANEVWESLLGAASAVDPKRMLNAGSASPPDDQYSRSNYNGWNLDNPLQYAESVMAANPKPGNGLEMHYYPAASSQPDPAVKAYAKLSLRLRRPVIVNEFGGQDTGGSDLETTLAANFNYSLQQLLENRAPLMACWYVGATQFSGNPYGLPCWITPSSKYAYQWNALAQANAAGKYAYGPWQASLAVGSGGTADVFLSSSGTTLLQDTTASARNLAANVSGGAATLNIRGSGQLVLGQNSAFTIPTTSDGSAASALTINKAHGQLIDVTGTSVVLLAQQGAAVTHPAVIGNVVSASRMETGDSVNSRANIGADTGELNLYDGLYVGQRSASGMTANIHQSGGIVRAGIDANLAGATPGGLVFAAPAAGGTFNSTYLLSGGTLALSGMSLSRPGVEYATGTAVTLNAILDWQNGTLSTLDGASATVESFLDARNTQSLEIKLNSNGGAHTVTVPDADQSMTVGGFATISGAGNLVKTGPGTLVLLGASIQYTFTGNTQINDGILQVKNRNALPGWNTAGKVSIGGRVYASDGTTSVGTLGLNVGGSGEWSTADLATILGSSSKISFGTGAGVAIDTSNASGTVTVPAVSGQRAITKLGTGTLAIDSGAGAVGIITLKNGTAQINGATAAGLNVFGGTVDLGGGSTVLSGSYQQLSISSHQYRPHVCQFSVATFAGGTVSNGSIVNNTSARDQWGGAAWTAYEAQSGSVSANLGGAAGLLKNTSGTITLSGNNFYTGKTLLANGLLVLGHNNALGTSGEISFSNGVLRYGTGVSADLSPRIASSLGPIAIDTNGQTVSFASSLPSNNTGGLKKLGAGILQLSASNNYLGGTWIDQGTLRTTVTGALAGGSPGDLVINNGAILDLYGTSQAALNLYSLGENNTSSILNNGGGSATLQITNAGNSRFAGTIADRTTGTGTVALIKSGSGTLMLDGINNFTGGLTVNAGTVSIQSDASLGGATNRLTLNGGILAIRSGSPNVEMNRPVTVGSASGTIYVPAGTRLAFKSPLTSQDFGKLTFTGGGTVILSESNINNPDIVTSGVSIQTAWRITDSLQWAGSVFTCEQGDSVTFEVTAATLGGLAGDGTFELAAGGNPVALTVGGLGSNTVFSGSLGGTGSLTKTGTGTLQLGGTNTYTGPTTITAGTLKLNPLIYVVPVSATAESWFSPDDRSPIRVIDGSGMSQPNSASATCDTGPWSRMWLSNGSQATWITFDLGQERVVSGFHLWNYNEGGGWVTRGVKTCGIYAGTNMPANFTPYSAAGPAWGTLVQNMTLARAPGTNTYTGEEYSFDTPVATRYLQIYVTSNFGGPDSYTGISEIGFYVSDPAMPSVLSPNSSVSISAGATFDVSMLTRNATYSFGSGATLTANGSGTTLGSSAAAIQCGPSGTFALGSQPIILNLASSLLPGDETHPVLYLPQGSLSLAGNPFTVNAPAPLAIGTYRLIQVGNGLSGVITENGTYPAVTGSAVANRTGVISVRNGNVVLTVTDETYAGWAQTHAAGQSPSGDHDDDGVPNGIEYFMGSTDPGFTPMPSLVEGEIAWPKSSTFVGDYLVQTSSDLDEWTDVPATSLDLSDPDFVRYLLPADLPNAFVRLKVVPSL